MTSIERVLTTLGHREPDRVPVFLLLTMHGAREVGVPLREYFGNPALVADGQVRLRARYGHDCLNGFHYAPVEIEAWGGEVVVSDDGPVNSGEPFIRDPEAVRGLEPPRIEEAPCLQRVLETVRLLKQRAAGEVPVIGVVMSPFSLPVMQMGFEAYLVMLHERPDLFARLMEVNEAFCVAWANAQFEAGATAIAYFDPVSSPAMVPPALYRRTGFEVAVRTLARFKGPTAMHFASGRCLPVVDDVVKTGAAVVGVSAEEDLAALKAACRGRVTLLGNLNGLAMRNWTAAEAEAAVRTTVETAGPGGGFILSDNHGEIPWQVPDEVLHAVMDAARRWGRYPLRGDAS